MSPSKSPFHHTPAQADALKANARNLLSFFRASLPSGSNRFDVLDLYGKPIPDQQQDLMTTCRLVHSYALGLLAGVPDCMPIIEAGIKTLLEDHRDAERGGFLPLSPAGGRLPEDKLAYGHVFVLLAASSAKAVGHPDADRLIALVSEDIDAYFWDEDAGRLRDEFRADWTVFSNYRGMNANMHGAEAFLTAYEVTGKQVYLDRAERILTFFIETIAPATGWRIPEHYDADWQVDRTYSGDPMFRPEGTTPGHSFEMARLYLQMWDLKGRPGTTVPASARKLVETAMTDAWQPGGGLAYTLTFDGLVDIPDRYWWPVTEAIGAYAALLKLEGRQEDLDSYNRLWACAEDLFIDRQHGGWFPEVNGEGLPTDRQFTGKPDIYHALQASLYPLTPALSRPHEGVKGLLA